MASTHALNKKPYRRTSPDEWQEIEAMYRAGATARVLAFRYDISERTIYGQAGKQGWLRRDHVATAPPMTAEEAGTAARALGAAEDGLSGDAACRALAADAPLDVAAQAAARSAVGMLRDGHVGSAQTYARVAGLLARLEPQIGGGAGDGEDPARADAALRFLAAALGVEVE